MDKKSFYHVAGTFLVSIKCFLFLVYYDYFMNIKSHSLASVHSQRTEKLEELHPPKPYRVRP